MSGPRVWGERGKNHMNSQGSSWEIGSISSKKRIHTCKRIQENKPKQAGLNNCGSDAQRGCLWSLFPFVDLQAPTYQFAKTPVKLVYIVKIFNSRNTLHPPCHALSPIMESSESLDLKPKPNDYRQRCWGRDSCAEGQLGFDDFWSHLKVQDFYEIRSGLSSFPHVPLTLVLRASHQEAVLILSLACSLTKYVLAVDLETIWKGSRRRWQRRQESKKLVFVDFFRVPESQRG